MNNTTFNIFTHPQDYENWDKHLEHAATCEKYDSNLQQRYLNSLQFLRTELGNHFLQHNHNKHKLYRELKDKTIWRAKDIIRLTETLIQLKHSDSNYQKLIRKIQSPKIYEQEGAPFCDIAHFYLNDFSIYFLEESKEPQPDMQITHKKTKDKVFIEITLLGQNDHTKELTKNYKEIDKVFQKWDEYLPYTCNLLRYIPKEEQASVIQVIEQARQEALENESIVTVHTDALRLTIAHMNKYNELQAFIEANNYRKGLLGAPINFNETKRIANNKIGKKARQIPANAAGLIYVQVHPLHFWQFQLNDTIDAFDRTLSSHPHIIGIIVYADILEDTPSKIDYSDHYIYSSTKPNGVVLRHQLFVRNPCFHNKLQQETQKSIYNAIII